MQETVLELKNYSVSFDTPDGEVQAVRNVDLSVKKGEILCIVGESGCGKTLQIIKEKRWRSCAEAR